jgi:hypothetical protein
MILPEFAEQDALVTVPVTESAVGCDRVSLSVVLQLCASVMVTVYVPDVRPVTGLPLWPPLQL